MEPSDTRQAYEDVRYAKTLHQALSKARRAQRRDKAARREARWLGDAVRLLAAGLDGASRLIPEAVRLPELADARADYVRALQGAWARRAERLYEVLCEQDGPRSPLIEALFPHLKWNELRRTRGEGAARYAKEILRRLSTSYPTRMLASDEYAFARRPVGRLNAAIARWERAVEGDSPSAERELAIRHALLAAAGRVRTPVAQAQLLAQASVVRFADLASTLGPLLKGRRRPAARRASAPAPEGQELTADVDVADGSDGSAVPSVPPAADTADSPQPAGAEP